MASLGPYHWLTSLKAAQLKAIAVAVGSNSTGNKAALITALQAHLPAGFFPVEPHEAKDPKGSQRNHDIISIDMGIRNLAYCRITLPAGWPSPTHGAKATIPTISEWARIAVSSAASTTTTTKKKKQQQQQQKKGPQSLSSTTTTTNNTTPTTAPNEAENLSSSSSNTTDPHPQKELFDPSTFSTHAYNLMTHLLNQNPSQPPTQILIERQRFRSMGGSAVQEWTLRVNMFESMLYAVLRTLREEGLWEAGGGVYAVAPSKVGRFWLGDEGVGGGGDGGDGEGDGGGEEGGRKGKKKTGRRKKEPSSDKSARTKTLKIKMVERWLKSVLKPGRDDGEKISGDDKFRLEGRARELGEAFLRKRGGKKDVQVPRETVEGHSIRNELEVKEEVAIGKLDDLADCVLQGLAWVKWEENRRKVVAGGADVVEELS